MGSTSCVRRQRKGGPDTKNILSEFDSAALRLLQVHLDLRVTSDQAAILPGRSPRLQFGPPCFPPLSSRRPLALLLLLRNDIPPTSGLWQGVVSRSWRMLPLALKIVWFVFAFLGIPAAWIVLVPFAGVFGVYWAPLLYCVAVTVLEAIFCLGMIWKMDPYSMPHAFCVTQTILIALSSHVLAGVCACFTWATCISVFRPSSIPPHKALLAWRKLYLFFIAAFPALASTAHIVVILKTDAVKPRDDLQCDVTSPLWPRVFSYAGAPLLMSVPCFIISTLTGIRLYKMHVMARRYGFSGIDASSGSHSITKSQLTSHNVRPTRQTSLKFLASNLNPRVEVKVDVQLPQSTQFSSHASLPQTPKSADSAFAASSSMTQFYASHLLPEPQSALSLPAPPSPTMSNKSSLFTITERTQTPSPITFAPVPPLKARQRNLNCATDPPELYYLPSLPDPGALVYAPDESIAGHPVPYTPSSSSRTRISLDDVDARRGFHLPHPCSPDATLRPSLELSPEYSCARIQEERELDLPAASASSAHGYPPLARVQSQASASLKEEDEITLEAIGCKERVLDGLREEEEEEMDLEDRKSVLKEELEFDDGLEAEEGMRTIPKVRQFYRSARHSIKRPSGLGPAVWRLVVFQLAFFFILALASLSTLIDLGKGRPPTPFGTQHVALLLAAWGPLIVFGHLPGVRERLIPFRRP